MVQSLADRSVLLDWSRFAVAYARALHGAGLPAPAVEDEVTRVLDARGVASTVMATPTALWVDVDGSRVVRVAPAPAHLARQVGLLAVGDRVADGAAPDVAEAELAALVARPGPWGRVADGIASIGLSAAAATLLGGTVDDVVAAGLLGLGAVAGHRALRDRTRWTWVADGTVALAVSVVAAALGAIGVDPGRTALAALVALAPGMQLATAAAETANGHWASGSARLAGAFVAMVQLGAGLAAGLAAVGPVTAWRAPTTAPDWLPILAHLALPPALAVLARARPVDVPGAVGVGLAVSAVTIAIDGPRGAFVGAAVAVAAGNLLSRWTRVPAAVFTTPALYLVVPGSLGVHGWSGYLVGSDARPLDLAWRTALAVVAGMLLAHAAAPARPGPARLDTQRGRG